MRCIPRRPVRRIRRVAPPRRNEERPRPSFFLVVSKTSTKHSFNLLPHPVRFPAADGFRLSAECGNFAILNPKSPSRDAALRNTSRIYLQQMALHVWILRKSSSACLSLMCRITQLAKLSRVSIIPLFSIFLINPFLENGGEMKAPGKCFTPACFLCRAESHWRCALPSLTGHIFCLELWRN